MLTTVLAATLLSLVHAGEPAKAASSATKPAGQVVFETYRCAQCHEVSKLGIKGTPKKGAKTSDLTGTGKRGAAFLSEYLLKKQKIDGKRHKKKFRGDKTKELKPLVDWLSTL